MKINKHQTLLDIFYNITWTYLRVLLIKFDLPMTPEPSVSLSNDLFEIGKWYHHPCFKFSFGIAWNVDVLLIKRTLYINIKGASIWGIRQPNFGGDVVAEIFSLLRLTISTCVARRRFLLPDIGSSSSNHFDPGHHYLLHALDIGLRVKSRAHVRRWMDAWRYSR